MKNKSFSFFYQLLDQFFVLSFYRGKYFRFECLETSFVFGVPDFPSFQIMDVVAHIGQRFNDVRGEDDGFPLFFQLEQDLADEPAAFDVEAVEGLVEDQDGFVLFQDGHDG